MTVNEIYTKHKKPITIVIICLIVLVIIWLIWFVLRKDKQLDELLNKDKAKDEYILEIRKQARLDLRVRDSLDKVKTDSMLRQQEQERYKVEYIIKWRTEYVTRFIDTASFYTKRIYLDSLFGPK